MKKIFILLALLLAACSPAPVILATPTARLTISQSNIVYDCGGAEIAGATVNGSGVTLRNCIMTGWSGTGLWVQGTNNVLENIVINDGVIGNGDKDGIRFFGSGHTFRNIKVTIESCQSPAHCDGVQTYGDNAGKNITFDGMEIHNFTLYAGSPTKGNCYMIENVAANITIKNSLLNCYRQIMLGDDRYPAPDRITIVNNTFVGKIPRPVETVPEFGIFVSRGTNVVAQKNVFYNLAGEHFWGTLTGGYNLVYRSDGGTLYPPRYSTDLWGVNPQLDSNYRPLASSPLCANGWGAYPCGTNIPTATTTVTQTPTATRTPTATPTQTKAPTVTPTPVCYPVEVGGQLIGNFCPP